MKNGEYLMSVAPVEYQGKKYRNRYAYDHHIAYWKVTGKVIESGFILHHKNKNKHDNRYENLEVLTNSEHSTHHGLEKVKKIVYYICENCHSNFLRKYRKPQRFCSRKCIGLYNFPSRVA